MSVGGEKTITVNCSIGCVKEFATDCLIFIHTTNGNTSVTIVACVRCVYSKRLSTR